MPTNYSDPAYLQYQWQDSPDPQPEPQQGPPPAPFYTDYGPGYSEAADDNIGAVILYTLYIVTESGDEIDLTQSFVMPNAFSNYSQRPLNMDDEEHPEFSYGAPTVTVLIQPGKSNILHTMLQRYKWTLDNQIRLRIYLEPYGTGTRCPVGTFFYKSITHGPTPSISMVDVLQRALDKEIYADSFYRMGKLNYQTTVVEETSGSTANFDTTKLYINPSACPIGEWEITITDNTAGVITYEVKGPGSEILTGTSDEDFMTEDIAANSLIIIFSGALSGDWSEDDTITFNTNFIGAACIEGHGYANPIHLAYYIIRQSGVAPEEFDAGLNFPYEHPSNDPENTQMSGGIIYDDDNRFNGKYDGENSLSTSWNYAYWIAQSALGKWCFDEPGTTCLQVAQTVLACVPAYLYTSGMGKWKVFQIGSPASSGQPPEIHAGTGLISAKMPGHRKYSSIYCRFAYDFSARRWRHRHEEPSGDTSPEGQITGEGAANVTKWGADLLGYQMVDLAQVSRTCLLLYLLNQGSEPNTEATLGVLHGVPIRNGLGARYALRSYDIGTHIEPIYIIPVGFDVRFAQNTVGFWLLAYTDENMTIQTYDAWPGWDPNNPDDVDDWPEDKWRYDMLNSGLYGS